MAVVRKEKMGQRAEVGQSLKLAGGAPGRKKELWMGSIVGKVRNQEDTSVMHYGG